MSRDLRLLGLLRAMVWMRWRHLVNSTKSVRRGDSLEHLSRVIGAALPFIFVITMIPTALILAGFGILGGRILGDAAAGGEDDPFVVLVALRALLFLLFLLVAIAPLLRSAFSANQGMVRLLLLPISQRLLHRTELLVGLSDPWLAVMIPGLLLLPLGALLVGVPGTSLMMMALVLLLVATLVALGACSASLCALLFRDRRRAEMATLVVMVVLSVVGLLPALLDPVAPTVQVPTVQEQGEVAQASEQSAESAESAQQDRQVEPGLPPARDRDESTSPAQPKSEVRVDLLDTILPPFAGVLPPELCSSAMADLSRGELGRAGSKAGALALWFVVLDLLSWRLFVRRLGQPESQSGRRDVAARRGLERFDLPGVAPTTRAVAWVTARSALRTVRGKTAVGLNGIIIGLTYLVLSRQFEATPIPETGAAVALVGGIFCFLSLQPVLFNHFAIDRAGLTLELLAPIDLAHLVRGKLVGGALLLAPAYGLCLVAALLVAPGGSTWLWLATLPAMAAGYAVYGPLGLVMSASFARNARLDQLGSAGNPHSLAGLAATLLAPAVMVPVVLLGLIGQRLIGGAGWTFVLIVMWLVCCLLVGKLILRWAERVVRERRENLQLVASDR